MIEYYRKLMNIDRLAGKFKLRKYDLAQHSYYTAILFSEFAKLEDISYDTSVLEMILSHDMMEVITTDLPWTCKNLSEKTKECWNIIEEESANAFPEFKKYSDEALKSCMTKEQHELFKCCDYLELFLFIHEERQLGNNTEGMLDVYNNCINLIKGKFKSIDIYMNGKCKERLYPVP